MLLTNLCSSLERERAERHLFGLYTSSIGVISLQIGVQEKTALPQPTLVYVFLLPFLPHLFLSPRSHGMRTKWTPLLRRERMSLQPFQCTIRVCLVGIEMPLDHSTQEELDSKKQHCSYFYAGGTMDLYLTPER
jgi:hypothetical protein